MLPHIISTLSYKLSLFLLVFFSSKDNMYTEIYILNAILVLPPLPLTSKFYDYKSRQAWICLHLNLWKKSKLIYVDINFICWRYNPYRFQIYMESVQYKKIGVSCILFLSAIFRNRYFWSINQTTTVIKWTDKSSCHFLEEHRCHLRVHKKEAIS